MQTNADRAQKGQAHEYLERFQKSVSQEGPHQDHEEGQWN